MSKVYKGYVRQCDLKGCEFGCETPEERQCEYQGVMIVPLDEAEMMEQDVDLRLQFGNSLAAAPWTQRVVKGPLCRIEKMRLEVLTPIE